MTIESNDQYNKKNYYSFDLYLSSLCWDHLMIWPINGTCPGSWSFVFFCSSLKYRRLPKWTWIDCPCCFQVIFIDQFWLILAGHLSKTDLTSLLLVHAVVSSFLERVECIILTQRFCPFRWIASINWKTRRMENTCTSVSELNLHSSIINNWTTCQWNFSLLNLHGSR